MRVLLFPIDEYEFSVRVVGDDEPVDMKIITAQEYIHKNRNKGMNFADAEYAIEIPLEEGYCVEIQHGNL